MLLVGRKGQGVRREWGRERGAGFLSWRVVSGERGGACWRFGDYGSKWNELE